MEIHKSGKPIFRKCIYEDLCQFLAQSQKIQCAGNFLNIENQSFQKRPFSCRLSSQGKLCGWHSYFPSVLYIDIIHICKKQK